MKTLLIKFPLCLLLITLLSIDTSKALNCYQCTGSDPSEPFQCNEWLTNDIDMKPEACDNVYGAKYCIKHTGRFEGGIGAKRFCSSLDLGNYCHYVRQPGDMLSYRTCIFTCAGDGCNSSTKGKPNVLLYLGLITLLVVRVMNFVIR